MTTDRHHRPWLPPREGGYSAVPDGKPKPPPPPGPGSASGRTTSWDDPGCVKSLSCVDGLHSLGCPAHNAGRPPSSVEDMARAFSLWLDGSYPADLDPETHMRRRVLKVCEESGEVHEAVGAYWGENPRKPRGPIEDVLKELADCAGAALGAIEHLTGHEGRSLDIVTARVREVCERVGIETAPARTPSRGDDA